MIKIYSGTETIVNLLKIILEENKIPSIIQNNFQSGLTAGFGTNSEFGIELHIQEQDIEIATPIIRDFNEINS